MSALGAELAAECKRLYDRAVALELRRYDFDCAGEEHAAIVEEQRTIFIARNLAEGKLREHVRATYGVAPHDLARFISTSGL